MALKTPLATIYEESGSFIASFINNQDNSNENKTDCGLISARSIPSVDRQRQRTYTTRRKPPIEVRFRDGSKRYIHPSTTAKMILNRRNLLDSSQSNFPPRKYVRFQDRPNSQLKARTRILTIITADDLRQAGITPPSSSSGSSADRSSMTPSSQQIDSPFYQLNTLETISEDLSTRDSSLQMTLYPNENEFNPNNRSTVIEYTNRSAFHPVLKPILFHQQPLPMKPRMPLKISRPIYTRTQQHIMPYSQSNSRPVSFIRKHPSSNHTDPRMPWLNITSDSLHEIPRLSSQYWRVPLRITLPAVSATHNQRFLNRHDTILEQRLLNAGLSPETVALYERILDIAGNNR